MSVVRDRHLLRCQKALKAVKTFAEEYNDNEQDALASRLRELPAMLLTTGLCVTVPIFVARGKKDESFNNALAMLLAGIDSSEKRICDDLAGIDSSEKRICDDLAGMDERSHRMKLLEAIAYAEELKRWGQAILKTKS